MSYRDVTLSPDDIEWERTDDPFADIRAVLFHDEDLAAYVQAAGLELAHELLTRFHREVANELVSRAVVDMHSSNWAGRTISMCRRLKMVRNRVRYQYGTTLGVDALRAAVARLEAEYPRAEWGSR